MSTWRDVRRFAMALPGVVESRSRSGRRAWLVDKKAFTWERPLGKADLDALGKEAPDGPILGVCTDGLEMKDALLASRPNVYFTTPHFNGYPAVLLRLPKISAAALKDAIVEAWFTRAKKRDVEAYVAKRRKKP